MVNQFAVSSKASTKEKRDGVYVCSWERLRQDTYVLKDGVREVLSTCIRSTDQDWPKYLPTYQSFNAYSWEYQTNFGGSIVATRRRAEAQTDIPRERVMMKFKDEDAEAMMAKALEGEGD